MYLRFQGLPERQKEEEEMMHTFTIRCCTRLRSGAAHVYDKVLHTSLTREILGSSYVETRFVPPKVNFLATTEFVASEWTSELRKITFLF